MPLHLILGSASEYPEEQLPIYRVVAFCRSTSRLYFLFFLPCTSCRSLLAWIAVDLPSLKPVWYICDARRCGAPSFIYAKMAFSMIFAMCDRTTMGRISSSPTGPFPDVF